MKRYLLFGNITVVVLILTAFLAAYALRFYAVREIQPVRQDAEAGWVDGNGNPATLADVVYTDGEAVLHRELNGEELRGADFCFISTNVNFSIYLENELIYDYHPKLAAIYGYSYGNDVHIVTLPGLAGIQTLRVELSQLGGGSMWSGFQEASFDRGDTYYRKMFHEGFWKYIITLFIFAIGMIFVILGFFFEQRSVVRLETISLGTMAMVLSLWTVSGTYMLEFVTENAGVIRVLNYLTLIVLPVPGLTLAACMTKQPETRSVNVVYAMTTVNLAAHLICLLTGTKDYHDLLFLTHITFLVAVGIAVWLFIRAFLKKKFAGDKSTYVKLIAFGLLVLTGVVDLAFYYIGGHSDMSRFSRFGLMMFVVILGVFEIHAFIVMTQKSREAEIMQRLAYEDGLTSLGNRLAFNVFEQELKQKNSGRCAFVQFDINNLKKMNDTYGHSEGDKFILAGAGVIGKSFGKCGRTFRTGGDEFIAVLEGENCLSEYARCEKEMLSLIETYNREEKPPIPLTVAYGMAEYIYEEGNLDEKEQLADQRMYELKHLQKTAGAVV